MDPIWSPRWSDPCTEVEQEREQAHEQIRACQARRQIMVGYSDFLSDSSHERPGKCRFFLKHFSEY